jgi:uncharacterized membrane protein (DUF4010 family)
VLLYRSETISASTATVAVFLATGASVVVKSALALVGSRSFGSRIARWSAFLLAVTTAVTVLVTTV